jgi:hypothetical protein
MKKSANLNQIILYVSHFLIVNAIFWGVRILNWWHFFGFPPMNPDFADIRAFTAQVTCAQKGIDYFETNCDPWNRGIGSLSVYVPILKLFNLNESRTGILGNTFQVVLFLSIYMVAYAIKLDLSKLKNGILMLFVLVSPPVAIAVERGQFEVVILALTILAGFLLYAQKQYIAYLIFGFLSVLKIYPIIVLILLLANRSMKKTIRHVFFGLAVIIISSVVIVNAISGQVDDLQDNALSLGFWRTFGVTVLPYLCVKLLKDVNLLDSDFTLSLVQAHALGMLFTFFLILVLYIFYTKTRVFGPNLTPLIEENSLRSIFILLNLSMICICYFVVSSFDYRMIYLIPLFLVCLAEDGKEKKYKLTNYFVYGTVFVMWAQVFIWTSALAQIPILVSLVLVLFNIGPILQSHYARPLWLKNL